MTSPVQGNPVFQNMGQVGVVSNEMVEVAKMALGTNPAVIHSSPKEIANKLKTPSPGLTKASYAQLKEIGGKIPENEYGIMGAVVRSSVSVREMVAKKVAGSEQAVFDEEHVVYPGEQDNLSGISKQVLPRISEE